jgi:hypothetical protein
MNFHAGERTRGRAPNHFDLLMLIASVLVIAWIILPH